MMNLDWNLLRAFHATATAGSLSAAARQLGLTQPTLSRQILALEASLGLALFDRPGRRLVLTRTGRDLLVHFQTMNDAAQSIALAASGQIGELRGQVSISVTDTYAAYIMPDILTRLRKHAPQLTLSLVAANTLSDLHRREADIAVRHKRPEQPGLTGQFIRDTEAYFYASKEWIARNGTPRTGTELAQASLIGFDDAPRYAAYLQEIGVPMKADSFRLLSDSSVAIWEMVRRGMGVAAMLREIADRTPEVERVMPDLPPIPVPIWLVTHQALRDSPRIRLVQRVLAEALATL